MDILAKNQFFNLLVDNSKLMDDDLDEIRKKGLYQFEKLGLPTSKSEEYKYTNISKALDKVFGEQIVAPEPLAQRSCSSTRRRRGLFGDQCGGWRP